MPTKEEYIKQLRDFLEDERIAGLAAQGWHNPRSNTTPLWQLFEQIEPMIQELEASGGTGWQGKKLISQINTALDVADKGLEHGEASGSAAALRAFVATQIAPLQAQIDALRKELTERIVGLEHQLSEED